jgi:alkylation response protein AidB-like acyl-CoA dehydrogenase
MRCNDPRFKPRGKLIGEFDSNIERVAQMRLELDAMRFVVYNAAETIDLHGPKFGKRVIAQSKILVPKKVENIINECMQVWGGQGVTNEHSPMPQLWAYARWARLADGPDSAHRHQVGREEMKKAKVITERHQTYNRKAKEFAEAHGEKIIMMPEDSL